MESGNSLVSSAITLSECAGEFVSFDNEHPYKQIELNATLSPNATAIEHSGKSYSYAWLNTSANQLAHYLIEENIHSGDRIVVAIDPSPFILVSILALHKIGAVYVPVDPNFPQGRIASMIETIRPKGLLLYSADSSVLSSFDWSMTADLQNFDGLCQKFSKENPAREFDLEYEAHIFFTSGTTGNPKAVPATHANLVHYLNSAQSIYGFDSSDKFISAARFTFSISLFELLSPLFVGASVHIINRNDVLLMGKMALYFESATVFHIGPSLLKKVIPYIEKHYPSNDAFSKMRHVSSGGDHVPVDILEKLKDIFCNAEVYVIYGSTEISCMGCTYLTPRDGSPTQRLVGRPHTNTRVRIEDPNGQLVPVNQVGEVLFSGPGVINSYLNLPDVSREKFVERSGKQFYKIGDLGQMNDEGLLQLSGRADFQVQFHGMRIELLEVETILKRIEHIEDCVVVGLNSGGKEGETEISLVAYLVSTNLDSINLQNIIDYLSDFLPDYSIPSKFVALESMPLNHNGKLDRSQLPLPTIENILTSSRFEPAENPTQKVLAQLWQDLFKLKGIGVNHNFFELGGDSLMAVQFLAEVDNQFKKFIPISSLLEYPTIRSLANIIDGSVDVPEMQNVNVLRQGDNVLPPLFCLYGVLLYQDLANTLVSGNLVCGVYLQEEVDLINHGIDSDEFKSMTQVSNIAEKYVQSITQYQQQGPYYLCGESFGGIIALEAAKILQSRDQVVALVAMFDTVAPGFLESLSRKDKLKIHLKQFQKHGIKHASSSLRHSLRRKAKYLRAKLLPAALEKTGSEDRKRDIRSLARAVASKSYRPEKTNHEIILFRATQRSAFEPDDLDLGWGKYVANVDVVYIDGTHLSILETPNVNAISEVLDSNLQAD